MKKAMLLVVSLMIGAVKAHAEPYFESNAGIFAGNNAAPFYGFRVGSKKQAGFQDWDYSLGYWSALGYDLSNKSKFRSDQVDLHTVSADLYRIFELSEKAEARFGGGLGYTIPNLSGGIEETMDNDLSLTFGFGIDQEIKPGLSFGAGLKLFLFRTDSLATFRNSHEETLSNGQTVEVEDVSYKENSVDFNAVMVAFSIKWK